MNFFVRVIWILQTILESLPISSSGHIKLLKKIGSAYSLGWSIPISEYVDHIMHAPTAIILVIYLLRSYFPLIQGLPATSHELATLILYIIIADLVTTLFYFALKYIHVSDAFLPIGFGITAIALLSLHYLPHHFAQLSMKHAIIIGIAQGCAMLPGVSRMAITFVTGCWLGLDPLISFSFSLAIQLPLIFAALAKSMYLITSKQAHFFDMHIVDCAMLAGATATAYGLLGVVAWMIQNNMVTYFGWYMIGVTILSVFVQYFFG